MKSKPLRKVIATMSMIAMTAGTIPVYAAVNSTEFQEALVVDGCDITAEMYHPDGWAAEYKVDYWSINDAGDGVKYTPVYSNISYDYTDGMIKLDIPSTGEFRTLHMGVELAAMYDCVKVYAISHDTNEGGILLGTVWNPSYKAELEEGVTYDDGTGLYGINIGASETEFYIVTDHEEDGVIEISNMSYSAIDSISYDMGSGSDVTTGMLDSDGVLTITGEYLHTTDNIPQIIKNDIKKVVLSEGMLRIITDSSTMFEEMTSIKEVVFPSTLEYIGASAFEGCTGLTEIYLDCPQLELNAHVFKDCVNVSKVYLNISSTPSSYTKGFAYSITTGEGGDPISPFQGVGANVGGFDIVIGEDMTIIGEGLFLHAYSIKSVTIPDSVTTMGVEKHAVTNTYRIFNTTDQQGDITLYTNNQTALDYDWSSDGVTVNTESYEDSDVTFGDSGSGAGGNGGGSGSGGFGDDNTSSTTITGTIQSVTTLDITIPLDGISFVIDEDRNFIANTTEIENNSAFPVEIYLASISGQDGTEPEIVEDDKYTEAEWNNLSKIDTLQYLALSINNENLKGIYNNTSLDTDKMIKLGAMKSGFSTEQTFELVPSAFYGKNFGNTSELVIVYDLIVEFRIP